MPTVKKDPHVKAKEILANCIEKPEYGGCLLWQGRVNERGYGYTQFKGRPTLVHKIVALYGVQRSDEQIEALKERRIEWTCGRRICLRLDGNHMHFTAGKIRQDYETMPTLDEMLRNRGITWL